MHLHQNTASDHNKTSMWRGKKWGSHPVGQTFSKKECKEGWKWPFTPAVSKKKPSAQIEAQHQTGKTSAICSQPTSGSTASSNRRTFKAIQRNSQHPLPCEVGSSRTPSEQTVQQPTEMQQVSLCRQQSHRAQCRESSWRLPNIGCLRV